MFSLQVDLDLCNIGLVQNWEQMYDGRVTLYILLDLAHYEVMLRWVANMALHEPMMTYICWYHSGVSGLDSVQNSYALCNAAGVRIRIQLWRQSRSTRRWRSITANSNIYRNWWVLIHQDKPTWLWYALLETDAFISCLGGIAVLTYNTKFAKPVIKNLFYIRAAGRRARSARRPAVQNVSVIAQGHGGGHASPIEAAGQWFY